MELQLQAKLPAQDVGEHQRSDNGCVAFHDEFGRMNVELTPSDFLIGNRTAIATVGGG
jgi:hypothetical protein